MTENAAVLLRPFGKIASQALLMPPSKFLIVGEELLVSGELPLKFRRAKNISLVKSEVPTGTLKECLELHSNAQWLGTRALADFTLPKSVLKRLVVLASDLESTHVRIFSDEERGIVGRLFDLRIGSDLLLPKNRRIHSSATLDISRLQAAQFSITLSIETLELLPFDDLMMCVYADGILEVQPVHAKFRQTFLCRDQGIHEPFTSFIHEALGRATYFVSHPNY